MRDMTRGSAFGWTATLLGMVAVLGGCLALVAGGGTDPHEGDCALEHRYSGAGYSAPSDPPRQPRGVRVVGKAEEIACGKVIGHVAAYAVTGVSPRVAVVLDGYLSVREGATPPRRLMRAAQRPVRCTRPTTFHGTWLSSRATAGEAGSYLRPYKVEIDATSGDHLPFESWQRLRITVEVSEMTQLTGEDERQAAYEQRPVEVDARCVGDRFVADRIVQQPHIVEPS